MVARLAPYSHSRSIKLTGFATMLAALMLAACQPAADIQFPESKAYETQPITKFTVYLRPDSAPQGTFKVTLNGNDITNTFAPAATPGATVNATAPANFALGKQTLVATAKDLRTPFPVTTDTVEFFPPVVVVTRAPSLTDQNLNHVEGQTLSAYAVITAPIPAPVTVTLSQGPGQFVSLNNQPVGTPITVVIPTNDRKASFTIRGARAGTSFAITGRATGFASNPSSGGISYP